MKRSRSWAVVIGAATVLVGTLGVAAPADATYTNEPLSRAWQADGPVHSSVGAGSVVYVGGKFNGGGGIAALSSSNGALLWSASTNGDVRALTVSSDGSRVFAGGAFTTVNGTTHRHLVALDSSSGDVVANWKASTGGMVRDLVTTGDTLFVGGTFAKINGATEKGLGALIASTGKSAPGFTNAVDKNVYGLALTPTTVIATGNFTLANGQSRLSIAAFNLNTYALTSWAPRRLCSGCNSYWDIAVDGTNAYVGTSGPGGNLGAFNLTTGSNPWRYVHADGDVQAVSLSSDGLLYIGGHFGQFVGNSNNPRTVLAAVNPANGSVDQAFHPRMYGLYPGAWTISTTNGVLWGGGDFNGTGAGANQANNHVPYLTAFAAQ